MVKKLRQYIWIGSGGLLVLLCLSCSSAPKDQPINFSGFLGYYTGFRPSPNEDGSWLYEKPGLNLSPYKRVMVDPLVIWNNPHPQKGGINDVDAWKLQLTFRDRVIKALGKDYPVVDQPGPNVLRVRAAVTNVAEEKAKSKSKSQLLAATDDLLRRSTETLFSTNILEGKASLEAELLNAQTGERLLGYIENRESSRNYVSDDRHNLGPIVEIFDYWAQKLRQRLERGRG